jgi:hypothetical protein
MKENDPDTLPALLLCLVSNLETLEIVSWIPSLSGHVFEFLTQAAAFYENHTPQKLWAKDHQPFDQLRRVTFHKYDWSESSDRVGYVEDWDDHYAEIDQGTLPIEKLVPFFHFPSLRVLEYKHVTSHNADCTQFNLPAGCSRIEYLAFDLSCLSDTALQALISTCKGLKSFHLRLPDYRDLHSHMFTYPSLGLAL